MYERSARNLKFELESRARRRRNSISRLQAESRNRGRRARYEENPERCGSPTSAAFCSSAESFSYADVRNVMFRDLKFRFLKYLVRTRCETNNNYTYFFISQLHFLSRSRNTSAFTSISLITTLRPNPKSISQECNFARK